MIGTMTPRRLSTPRTYSGCLGRWVISDQILISRTAMMSTPYCSSPIEKLMNSTRPAVEDSLGFALQSSWLAAAVDTARGAGAMFTLFALQELAARARTDRDADRISEDRGPSGGLGDHKAHGHHR